MDVTFNTGVIVLNKPEEAPPEKTVVVIGMARSGTSMFAKILQNMGVHMGTRIDPTIVEDEEVRIALEESEGMETFRDLVRRRNESYTQWGWKRPEASYYIDRYINEIRNPYFIIPFRDYIAIASRAKLAANHDIRQYIIGLHREQYKTISDFIATTDKPCCLISYEKGILKKESVIQELAAFLDIQMTDEMMERCLSAIEPDNKDYIQKTTLEHTLSRLYSGCLGRFKDGVLKGWVKKNNVDRPVELKLFINDQPIQTFRSDMYRADLERKGFGNGAYGFQLDLSDRELNKGDRISVVTTEDGFEIPQSPIIID